MGCDQLIEGHARARYAQTPCPELALCDYPIATEQQLAEVGPEPSCYANFAQYCGFPEDVTCKPLEPPSIEVEVQHLTELIEQGRIKMTFPECP